MNEIKILHAVGKLNTPKCANASPHVKCSIGMFLAGLGLHEQFQVRL